MKTNHKWIPVILFTLFLCINLFAQEGQTITLTVPVQIDNLMDEVVAFEISAHVYDANDKKWASKESIVDNSQFGANNSYSGNVTVVLQKGEGVNAVPDAGLPVRYSCILRIRHPVNSVPSICWAEQEQHPECSHREGSVFVPVVEGTIP